ncbi:MAG: sugar-binding domain-containing protein [bacterium]
MRNLSTLILATLLLAPLAVLDAAEWKPVPGHIMTQWAEKVDPNNPLPEYPRPQLERANWVNLNGLWDYAVTKKDAQQPTTFEGKILVPFCIESALSGVKRKFMHDDQLWYSRTFSAPVLTKGERLMLNFGAVDYEATVRVNGKEIGKHKGGYDAFSFDITDALKTGDNTLVVSVLDGTGDGPFGKQRVSSFDKPDGIFYTATSGIWQTVWLEKVPESPVTSLKITPDIDQGTLTVIVNGKEGAATVSVLDGGKEVASQKGKAGEPIVLNIPNAKLWSPESPFLYDLKITLGSDSVKSYAGMRKISKGKDEKGVLRPMLNNKPVFLAGPLDQGYWPDGIYTAPTDEALKYDIEMTKKFGFNMTRKHIKVEPARWFYWTDKLGLLVWQDMPSGIAGKDARGDKDGVPRSKELADQHELEMRTMVEQHVNSPSIIWWVVFNESWGQYDTPRLTKMVKDMDPTRLVTGGSGWFDAGCGDAIDRHHYQSPAGVKPEGDRLGICGEFGGLGYVIPGHIWVPEQTESSVYITCVDQKDYEKQYLALWKEAFDADLKNGTSAAVYTEITDIEKEVNGLMTYDRKVNKANPELFAKAIGKREFPPESIIKTLVPTSEKAPQEWSYTVEKPSDDWFKPGADISSWKKGTGIIGFKEGKWGMAMSTEWHTSDIWMLRTFEMPAEKVKRPVLRATYARNATIYFNGVKALDLKRGYMMSFVTIPLSTEAAALLKPGINTLAIHAEKKPGEKPDNQFIDVGLGDETITW